MSAVDRILMFRTFLEQQPGDRFALYALALELRKTGAEDESLALFDTLLELHPSSGAGHLQRGLLLLDLGEVDAARRGWEAALTILSDHDDPEAVRSRGEIRAAIDDLDV